MSYIHVEADVEGTVREIDVPLETIFKLHCRALELFKQRKSLLTQVGNYNKSKLIGNEEMMKEIIELQTMNLVVDFGLDDIFPVTRNGSYYGTEATTFLSKPHQFRDSRNIYHI